MLVFVRMKHLYIISFLLLILNTWCSWFHPAKERPVEETSIHPANLTETAHNIGQSLMNKTEEAVEWTSDKAHEAADWTREKTSSLLNNLRQRLTGIPNLSSGGAPPIEVRNLPEDYLIFLAMAGIPRDKIKVQVARSRLMIWGSHEECLGKGGRRVCVERAVEESFDLPEDADAANISCWMELQVLVVRIPRRAIAPDHVVKVGERGTLDKILQKVGLEDEL